MILPLLLAALAVIGPCATSAAWTQVNADRSNSGRSSTTSVWTPFVSWLANDFPTNQQSVDIPFSAAPVVAGGRVFVWQTQSTETLSQTLFALNETNGATLWTFMCPYDDSWADTLLTLPITSHSGGRLYLICTTGLGPLALETRTGALLWSRPDLAPVVVCDYITPCFWSSTSPDESIVYFGPTGTLLALNTSTGETLAQIHDSQLSSQHALDSHGRVYTSSLGGSQFRKMHQPILVHDAMLRPIATSLPLQSFDCSSNFANAPCFITVDSSHSTPNDSSSVLVFLGWPLVLPLYDLKEKTVP